jgi:hypothetical protein
MKKKNGQRETIKKLTLSYERSRRIRRREMKRKVKKKERTIKKKEQVYDYQTV